MSRPFGFGGLFSPRTAKRAVARKRRDRRPVGMTAPESLESRALLAFSVLPAAGDMLGGAITITADGAHSQHDLTLILDDKTNPGSITATVTAKDSGGGFQKAAYYNFSGISFKAFSDTDGVVANNVSLFTSYDADLAGYEVAPSKTSAVGLATNWQVKNQFPAGISLGKTSVVDLWNADSLAVSSGILGGGVSTIVGEFESPTLLPSVNGGASISLKSGVGIGDANDPAGDIVAYTLALESQTGDVTLSQDVFTTADLSIKAAQDIFLAGLLNSTAGDIEVDSTAGDLVVSPGAKLNAVAGDIRISATRGLASLRSLFAGDSITVNALGDVTLNGVIQSVAGSTVISSDTGLNVAATVQAGADIELNAKHSVTSFTGGIEKVEVLSGGSYYEYAVVTIAAPASGQGRAALGRAVIGFLPGLTFGPISEIVVIDPGYGYAPGEQVAVEISGSPGRSFITRETFPGPPPVTVETETVIPPATGAFAVAVATSAIASLTAGDEIRVNAVHDAALDMRVDAGSFSLDAKGGFGRVERLVATGDVKIAAAGSVSVTQLLQSTKGDVSLTTTSGDIDLSAANAIVHAVAGSIALESKAGGATVRELRAGAEIDVATLRDLTILDTATAGGGITLVSQAGQATVKNLVAEDAVTVTGLGQVTVAGEVTANTGDVTVTSTSGVVSLGANIHARDERIQVTAHGELKQALPGGLAGVEVLSGGSFQGDEAPEVTVTFATPVGGGTAATATAVVEVVVPGDPATGADPIYAITSLILTNAGNGYQVGELPAVTVTGMPGASARAIAPAGLQNLIAGKGITLSAGDDVTLTTTVRSNTGDVTITSTDGDLDLSAKGQLVHAVAGSVALQSKAGSASTQQLTAGTNVSVTTLHDATLAGAVDAKTGSVTVTSTSGDVSVREQIHAQDGSITLLAQAGQATVKNLVGEDAVTVTGLGQVTVAGEVTANTGDVTVTSTSGVVSLGANIHARDERILVTAHSELQQSLAGGLTGVEVLAAGSFVGFGRTTPTVTVTIAAPVNGGTVATAVAILDSVYDLGSPFALNDETTISTIRSIVLTNPGSGYAIGETPAVTITGMPSAAARAITPDGLQNLIAGKGITLTAGADVTLTTTVRSNTGNVSITSIDGDLDLSAKGQLVHAVAGNIVLESKAGGAEVQQLTAATGVSVSTLHDFTLLGPVDTKTGSVTVASTSGDLDVRGKIHAQDGSIALTAQAGTASVRNLVADDAVTVKALGQVTVTGEVTGNTGDVSLTSTLGVVSLAANVNARDGHLLLAAHSELYQVAPGGIVAIELISSGSYQASYSFATTTSTTVGGGAVTTVVEQIFPTVTVTVAAPAGGGQAATAVAVIEQIKGGTPATSVGGVFTPATNPTYAIASIVLTNPGVGYRIGEIPRVTITGMPGASATAVAPVGLQNLVGGKGVTLSAGDDVRLVSTVRSDTGAVKITSIDGDIDLAAKGQLVHAVAGGISLESKAGQTTVQQLTAGTNIDVRALRSLTVLDTATAGGSVALESTTGQATVRNLRAENAVTVTGQTLVTLAGEVTANTGDVNVTSTSGVVSLAANIHARDEQIIIAAHSELKQASPGALAGVEVLLAGSNINKIAPTVTATVTAPRGGGTAATAVVTLGSRAVADDTAAAAAATTDRDWFIESITLTNTGSGYAVGETPDVTITGMPGASARAIPPVSVQNLVAGKGITLTAGNDVSLVSAVRANTGAVRITSTDGELDLGAQGQLVHAVAGSVTLESKAGGATLQELRAGTNVTVSTRDTVTLLDVVDADTGDVSITSRNRDLDFTAAGAQVHAPVGSATLAAPNGSIFSPPTLHVGRNATLTSFNTLVLNNEITADTGVIDVKSTSGSINLGANLDARDDSIRLSAKGAVTQIGGGIGSVRMLTGGSGYTAAATVTIAAPSSGLGVAARAVPIIGRVNGVNGVITGMRLTSLGSGYGAGEQPIVTISRNGAAPVGATEATAMAVGVPALGNSGLAAIDMLAGGSGYDATTRVTIARPAGGGAAATAEAVIATVEVDGTVRTGVIIDIVIVNPGSGYGAGEQPAVTITGAGTGAVARAIANITLQDIRAGNNIDIAAGTGVTLLNTVRAENGDVRIGTAVGNVSLAARTQLVSSFAGDIGITAPRGAIVAQRLAADGDITLDAQTGVTLLNAVNSTGAFGPGNLAIKTVNGNIAAVAPNGLISVQNGGVSLESVNGTVVVPQVFNVAGDIALRTYGSQVVSQPLTSANGSITLASATGVVDLRANVVADDRVTLTAKNGISQSRGFLKGTELVARNDNTAAIALTNSGNDFANVSLRSLGSVTYVDANEFETGVVRSPYSGTPLGVEISGDAVSLSSVAPYSRIRVVSGLSYRTLTIAAGTQSNSTVGYVEYVTTNGGDNFQANATFRGSLRDMIRYANDNAAQYSRASTLVPQPQAMVFDEFGYTVEEVKLGAALPAFNRPVWFDGGRLEAAATVERVGIAGTAAIPYGLMFAAATPAVPGRSPAYPGSAGSTIQSVAAYGFTKGSGVVLASGNNTVRDLHAGIRANGTVAGNFVGLDVTGVVAVNNQIGSAVFDPSTVNRFGGNSSAGILIRNGAAGTRVFGSVIGDDTGVTPALANGDGIRISNSTRNWIGTPDEVQIDSAPSRSNVIAGNKLAGIQIADSVAGTADAANLIRNNHISGNGTGVSIAASRFAVLGGTNGRSANVIVRQAGNGVVVGSSSDVKIQGNRVGVVPAFGGDAEAVGGNGGDGIRIEGTSQRVEISAGNWVGGNKLNGVAILAGATGVTLSGNTIGGMLADGTSAGNTRDGVAITAAIGNAVAAGNVISMNQRHGVSVTDARATTLAAGNRVFGSFVGSNAGSGIVLSGGSMTTVGGTTAGTANVITGNTGHGIRVETTKTTGAGSGHAIQGNRVGTTGNMEVDTTLGNGQSGISLAGAVGVTVDGRNVVMNNGANGIDVVDGSTITIGSATPAVGNVITNNVGSGVALAGKATGIAVIGNTIAEQGADGVQIGAGVRGVRIGQTVTQQAVTGAGNTIRGNDGWGVRINANAQQIGAQGNAVFDNALGVITHGTGVNTAAPATVSITSAITRTAPGGTRQLVLTGSLVGPGILAKQQYSVDVFADSATAANPQARRYLGRFTVTAAVNGRVNFTNVTITANVAVNEFVVATATSMVFDPGSTSRASAAVRARLR